MFVDSIKSSIENVVQSYFESICYVQYSCIWAKQIILGASSLNHGAMSRPNDMFEYQFMYITYW